jgi:PEGA domain
MTLIRSTAVLLVIALALGMGAGPASAAQGIQVALGETVPLSGYASGSNWVYLYLTGPNLPVNGVTLNDVTKRADQGYFTKVAVDGNDYWSYKWSTSNVGGRLDEGTYTIWVVNGPNDLSHLSEADYGTIAVTLGKPILAVDTVQPSGSMEITSVPPGATVMVNDVKKGITPLSVPDLTAGTYRVTFSLDRYAVFTTPVRVEAGRISEVTATLVSLPEPTPVVTTPAVTVAVPTTTPMATPVPTHKAAGIMPAVSLAGVILSFGICRRYG